MHVCLREDPVKKDLTLHTEWHHGPRCIKANIVHPIILGLRPTV